MSKSKNNSCIWLLITLLTSVATENCPQKCQCSTEIIHCSRKGLQHIPPNLTGGYEELDFSNNNIETIQNSIFQGLSQVTNFEFSSSNVKTIELNAFSGMLSLEILALKDNNITQLHPDTFLQNSLLKYLDLSNNKELQIPQNGPFLKIPTLTTLILSSCNIGTLSKHTFSLMNNLNFLYLEDNKLTSLNLDIFQHLENLDRLHLNENSLKCDCPMQNIKNWVSKNNIDVNDNICSNHEQSSDCATTPVTMVEDDFSSTERISSMKEDQFQSQSTHETQKHSTEKSQTNNDLFKRDNDFNIKTSGSSYVTTLLSDSTIIVLLIISSIIILVLFAFCIKHCSQRSQQQRDVKLVETVISKMKQENEQREQSVRYSPTPTLTRNSRRYSSAPSTTYSRQYLEPRQPSDYHDYLHIVPTPSNSEERIPQHIYEEIDSPVPSNY